MNLDTLIDKLRKGQDAGYYVAVVPINPFGEVLVGERREDGIWTTPAGGANDSEGPVDCAVRECWEEANLIVDRNNLELIKVKPAPNGKPVYCFLYRTDQMKVNSRLDPDREVGEWKWTKREELPKGFTRKKNSNRLETINEAFMKFYGLTKSEDLRWVNNSVAAPTENTDSLLNRREDKYVVAKKYLGTLTAKLKEYLKDGESDTHARYNVNRTIYLDTKDLDCFKDAINGVTPRFKLRIRRYAPNGVLENVAYLELKIKTEDGLTKKSRFRIPERVIDDVAVGKPIIGLTEELINLNRDITSDDLVKRITTINGVLTKYGFRQQIAVSYERRAYSNDELRVTVDDDIKYTAGQNIGDLSKVIKNSPGWDDVAEISEHVKTNNSIILEVKHKTDQPSWVTALLKEVKAESIKFSKYCVAIYHFIESGQIPNGSITREKLIDASPLIALFEDGSPMQKSDKDKKHVKISAVVLRDKNFILMGRRSKDDRWGLPGGRFDGDESKEEVALRELKEETGIKLEAKDLVYEGYKTIETDDEIKSIYIFSAKHPGGEPTTKKDPDEEFAEWEWIRCEDGQLPSKILDDKMNKPTEVAFEKMGLTKGRNMDDSIYSLIDKLNKGGEGSGVVGHTTPKSPSAMHGHVYAPPAKPVSKIKAHLQSLEHGVVIPDMKTQSGKPVVNTMEAARAHGYTAEDHVDAMNAHYELADKTQKVIDKLKMAGHKIPFEADKIVRFHAKKMKEHMQGRDFLERRSEHTAEAVRSKSGLPSKESGQKIIKGGPGSGIIGHTTAKKEKPNKLKRILGIVNQLEAKGIGFFNRSGDDMTIWIRGAHGNDPNQWHNARAVQDALGVHGGEITPDPQSGHLLIHVKNAYKDDVKKSITQMGGSIGDPDLDTGNFAQAQANLDQDLLQRFYRGMDNFSFGELPRQFSLDKGTLYLSMVDDGMYSGYFTKHDGEMRDNVRIRIDKMNLPDVAALVSAKEWASQVKSQTVVEPIQSGPQIVPGPEAMKKEFNEMGMPMALSNDEQVQSLTQKLNDQTPEPLPSVAPQPEVTRGAEAITILQLVAKLLQR